MRARVRTDLEAERGGTTLEGGDAAFSLLLFVALLSKTVELLNSKR
jgi:hypothetical protein